MHELSLSSAILDTAVRHAAGRRVACVELRVGQLRQVFPESLRFYFEIVARGTVCEDAELRIEPVEALLRCPGCAREWSIDMPAFRCPVCGGADVQIAAGNEFRVESIDVLTLDEQEAQEACIAPR